MTAPIIPGAEPFSADGGPQARWSCTASPATPGPCGAWPRRWPPRVHGRPPAVARPRHRGRGHDPDRLVGLVRLRRGGVRSLRRPAASGSRSWACRWAAPSPSAWPPRIPRWPGSSASTRWSRRRRGWPRACRRCSTRASRRWRASGRTSPTRTWSSWPTADAAPAVAHDVRGRDGLRGAARAVVCPVLVMHSPQDHVVPPENSDLVAEGVAGPVERVSLDRSYHVATQDYDKDLVEAKTVEFVTRTTA